MQIHVVWSLFPQDWKFSVRPFDLSGTNLLIWINLILRNTEDKEAITEEVDKKNVSLLPLAA